MLNYLSYSVLLLFSIANKNC